MNRLKASLLRGGLCASLLSVALQAHAVEILHWDRKPLDVDLPVGTERVIVLDRNVRVGLPREIADPDTLRVQSAGGAIYLKAGQAFDTQRVRIQDVETNEVVLFDLTAKESGASDEDIKVVFPDDNAGAATGSAEAEPDNEGGERDRTESSAGGTPVPVVLTSSTSPSRRPLEITAVAASMCTSMM